MREGISKRLATRLTNVTLSYNPICEDPNCNHRECIMDEKSGQWFKRNKVPFVYEGDEMIAALLAEQLTYLKSLRSMVLFFTVLVVISLIISVASGVVAGVGILSFLK